MSLYKIEIFSNDFEYKDSYQVEEISYEFDYLSLSNNKIKLPFMDVARGDFIRISKNDFKVCGIVEGVSESDTNTNVEFKHFMNIFDTNVWIDLEEFNSHVNAIEQLLAAKIKEMYLDSEDTLQNIKGLTIRPLTYTPGTKKFGLEENINNLYEILKLALIKHDIVVDIDIDVQTQKIDLVIRQTDTYEKYIEADLPNVLKKNVVIKKDQDSTNKLYIVNELEPTQKIAYYLGKDGTIATDMSESNRITPVIYDFKSVEPKEDETFEDLAYQEALQELIQEEYDNLIEITVLNDDTLVQPSTWSIGDRAVVIHKGNEYHTILTGIKIDKSRTMLIFGAVRMELTKKIKRRMK